MAEDILVRIIRTQDLDSDGFGLGSGSSTY